MWTKGPKHKRKKTSIDTMIGANTEVVGDMRFNGCLLIEGTVKGNVVGQNDDGSVLSLTKGGRIEGEVMGPYLVLNGEVVGDVRGGQHVELAANARITGNVYYNLIEIAVGAEVNGKLVHTPESEDPSARHERIEALEASELIPD